MKSIREQIIAILTSKGFDAKGAENGKIGLEMAKTYSPDLIICDIMMPELDGYEVLSGLRQEEKYKDNSFYFYYC